MKRRFQYSLKEMTVRLFAMARSIRIYLVISALASMIGNLSHMGLMGFGTMWLMRAGGYAEGPAGFYCVMTVVCAVLIPVCRYLEGVFSHIGAYGILARLRVHLFTILERVSPAYMIERKKGELLNIAVSDIETLEFFFAHTIGPMFTVILLPLVTLGIAAHVNMAFFWILLPVYALVSVILPLAALKLGRNIGMKYRESLGSLKAYVLESIYGMKDIQIYGHGKKRTEGMREENRRVSQASHGMVMHGKIVESLPNFFVYLARILIVAAGAGLVQRGIGDPSGTVMVSFVAAASFSSTFSLTFVVSHLLEAYAAAERFFVIEDASPLAPQANDARKLQKLDEIVFRNVSFRYPHAEEHVLEHMDLSIHKGEQIGICGESGIGKSTILRLLLRFYDPDSGTICFDGMDAKEVSFDSLYTRIGMLEQETYLFDASIRENIGIGKANASMEEIRTAARRAGIADLIEHLPDGYETQMGQMAARLSGGERQRIGIARVLLADPDVIVMDEPTSALDVFHEKELLETIRKEYAGHTVILISHRMSTLSDCERIYAVRDGKMVPLFTGQ